MHRDTIAVTPALRGERRAIALVAGAAAVVGLASSVLWDATRHTDGTFIAHTADLVTIGEDKATLFRVAMLADTAGSHLLFLPLAVYLRRATMTAGTTAADHAAIGGIGYAIVGGVGAAVLASAGAPLIRAYAEASAGDAVHIATTVASLTNAATPAFLSIAIWPAWLAVLLWTDR